MEWGTLAAVALGAVFGIGSTVLTDRMRRRHESDQRWADIRRAVYVRFLVALSQAHSRMVMAAFREQSADERVEAVHRAFHNDPRHSEAKSVIRELGITAPDPVFRAALEVYEQLRAVRECLALPSVTATSEGYRSVVRPFFAGLENLQRLMRDDLRPARPFGGRSGPPGEGIFSIESQRVAELSTAE